MVNYGYETYQSGFGEEEKMKYNIDKELKNLAKYKGSAVVRLYPLLNIAYKINGCKSDDRLLPKYRYPIAIEDCYNTYIWAVYNAEQIHINSDKIIVAGDSAGANIASAVAMMLKDRKQLLQKGYNRKVFLLNCMK
jgi:hypothetical protein